MCLDYFARERRLPHERDLLCGFSGTNHTASTAPSWEDATPLSRLILLHDSTGLVIGFQKQDESRAHVRAGVQVARKPSYDTRHSTVQQQ